MRLVTLLPHMITIITIGRYRVTLRHTEDDDLNLQLDLFDDLRRQDDESLCLPSGIDLNNQFDMFNALFWKVNSMLYIINRLNFHVCMTPVCGGVGE